MAQLLNKQVTFPFKSDSDSSYTLPDQSDPEIVFQRQPSRLETLNILIDKLQSFSQGNTMQTSEQFQSAIEPDDQYIDDTFADHSKMADDSVAYDTSANRDPSNTEPLNSFGTHVNTSRNMIDDVGNQQFADVLATLSQITEELSKISANQIHFKEGMERLNENQHQLQEQNTITANLVSGLRNEVAQVKHNITEEVSTAKQYTHSLFNNLKLELNPCIDYLTDRQVKLEHHLQHDQQIPSEPFASTPHTSKQCNGYAIRHSYTHFT